MLKALSSVGASVVRTFSPTQRRRSSEVRYAIMTVDPDDQAAQAAAEAAAARTTKSTASFFELRSSQCLMATFHLEGGSTVQAGPFMSAAISGESEKALVATRHTTCTSDLIGSISISETSEGYFPFDCRLVARASTRTDEQHTEDSPRFRRRSSGSFKTAEVLSKIEKTGAELSRSARSYDGGITWTATVEPSESLHIKDPKDMKWKSCNTVVFQHKKID